MLLFNVSVGRDVHWGPAHWPNVLWGAEHINSAIASLRGGGGEHFAHGAGRPPPCQPTPHWHRWPRCWPHPQREGCTASRPLSPGASPPEGRDRPPPGAHLKRRELSWGTVKCPASTKIICKDVKKTLKNARKVEKQKQAVFNTDGAKHQFQKKKNLLCTEKASTVSLCWPGDGDAKPRDLQLHSA